MHKLCSFWAFLWRQTDRTKFAGKNGTEKKEKPALQNENLECVAHCSDCSQSEARIWPSCIQRMSTATPQAT